MLFLFAPKGGFGASVALIATGLLAANLAGAESTFFSNGLCLVGYMSLVHAG